MDNKELGPEVPQASHNEKHALDGIHSDIPAGSGGRRGSTALNIVENPLQVRWSFCSAWRFLGCGCIAWPRV